MRFAIRKFILTVAILALLPIQIFAAPNSEQYDEIIQLDNGCYITVELHTHQTRAINTTSGSKIYVYRNSSGSEEWRATLTGTFTYNGTSATCTVPSLDVSISKTAWYVISKTAARSGNEAIGELTMGLKFLGITIDQVPITLKITCDPNGNLS